MARIEKLSAYIGQLLKRFQARVKEKPQRRRVSKVVKYGPPPVQSKKLTPPEKRKRELDLYWIMLMAGASD
jgi:hypothetical protein